MRVVFAGTPEFAVPTLSALFESHHQVVAVLCQPDRPAGRGRKVTSGPIKRLAQSNGVPVLQPQTLRGESKNDVIHLLEDDIDVMVVVAYGLILPEQLLSIPRFGCINIHPSKLPLWRGAAPIQYSILSGSSDTAMTLIQMDKGMDTGDILYQEETQIESGECAQELHDRMAILGANALLETLERLENGQCGPVPQNHENATYSEKIIKAHGLIDWSQSAENIVLQVRAYNPWPVAFTHCNDQQIRIWRAEVIDHISDLPPGTVASFSKKGLDIATGDGCVRVIECQRPGSKVMSIASFFNSAADEFIVGESVFQ